MTDRVFVDTNIVIYSQSNDTRRNVRAIQLIKQRPIVSTQVINETISVLVRKCNYTLQEAFEIAESLLILCEVMPVNRETVSLAIQYARRYHASHWDALIIAAALQANCSVLFSEDMQHNQVIEQRLTIINPFLITSGNTAE